MPSSRRGRVLAGVYLLAVAASLTTWMLHGAYSFAVLTTVVLTLPWSVAAYALLVVAALLMAAGLGAESGPGQAALTAVAVVLFLGAAAANVVLTRPVLARWRERRSNATV